MLRVFGRGSRSKLRSDRTLAVHGPRGPDDAERQRCPSMLVSRSKVPTQSDVATLRSSILEDIWRLEGLDEAGACMGPLASSVVDRRERRRSTDDDGPEIFREVSVCRYKTWSSHSPTNLVMLWKDRPQQIAQAILPLGEIVGSCYSAISREHRITAMTMTAARPRAIHPRWTDRDSIRSSQTRLRARRERLYPDRPVGCLDRGRVWAQLMKKQHQKVPLGRIQARGDVPLASRPSVAKSASGLYAASHGTGIQNPGRLSGIVCK